MISIDFKDYTKNVVIPIVKQKTLDDSLNQAVLTVRDITLKEPFEPLDTVIMDGEIWSVATDKVTQTRFGKNPLYKHDVSIIEQTKELERHFVDSCTFRNPLVKLYLDDPINAPYRNLQVHEIKALFEEAFEYSTFLQTPTLDNTLMSINSSLIKTPKAIGTNYTSPQFNSITGLNSGSSALFGFNTGFILKNPNGEIIDSEIKYNTVNTTTVSFANATKGNYSLYCLVDNWSDQTAPHMSLVQGIEIKITVMSDLDELDDWTITDVVNRLINLTETRRHPAPARFTFNSEQAEKYSSMKSPEFTITKMNLFEALKMVGGYIHAIPQLDHTEISFKELSDREYAILPDDYVAFSSTQSLEQFCSEIDTNVDNLVNVDDSQSGSIIEPYGDGLKTARAETGTAIITDDNCVFETTMPIERIDYLELGFLSDGTYIGDATKYVFEKSEYDSLSSYSGEYPWSKAYALYFKQGTQNIYGMQFEEESSVSQIFKQQAIINILEAITGGDYATIFNAESIIKLQYRIKYKPLISSRLKQRKTYLGATKRDLLNSGYKKKSVLAYNQSANKVDTDYYGENLKGVVERLGNIEKTYTYITKLTEDVPEVGQLFDKDYWIAVVKEEDYKNYRKYTLGLSKDFNRRNEYVGIDNNKRYAEVDERITHERFVIYEDYLVISDDFDIEVDDFDKSIASTNMLKTLKQNMIATSEEDWIYENIVTCIQATTYDKDMSPINKVVLPAIASHLGNSAFYQIEFQDNFGAGNKIDYMLTEHKGTQTQAEYGDDYGRAEYLKVRGLYSPLQSPVDNYAHAVRYGNVIPNTKDNISDVFFNTLSNPIILEKDSAEKIICAYQIHCVTDRYDVVVGSGLPKKLGVRAPYGYVDGTSFFRPEYADVYIMDREIGKFEKSIEDLPDSSLKISYTVDIDSDNTQLVLGSITANSNGNSIVLVDRYSKELIFAINKDIISGKSYSLPKMCFRHKI